MRQKILAFFNIPAPYNIPLFRNLHRRSSGHIHFHFDKHNESNRQWKLNSDEFDFTYRIHNAWHMTKLGAAANNTSLVRTLYLPFHVFVEIWRQKPFAVLSIEFGLRTLFAKLMCALIGAKLVIVSDVTAATEANVGGFKKWLRGALAKGIGGAVARSHHAKQYLQSLGIPANRIVVAPYAAEHISDGSMLPLEIQDACHSIAAQKAQGKFCFLYVGHYIHLKGIDLLVNAIEKLPQTTKDSLVIFFVGGKADDLLRLGASMPTQRYRSLGYLPGEHLQSVYRAADCFVLPTRSDTWALVVNEAMMAGCPVVVSKYAGCANELVQHNKTGIVIDPLDIDDFAHNLGMCIQQKEILRGYAARATEQMPAYSNDVAAERIMALLAQLGWQLNQQPSTN